MDSINYIGKSTPYHVAMKDITDYLSSQRGAKDDHDVWEVTPSRFFNQESRRLNMELGLHRVNKHGVRMRRKRK